jgi:hypothetical protein
MRWKGLEMSGQISIRLPPALRAQVQREAAARGITRTDWLVHLIERGQFAEDVRQLLPRNGQAAAPHAASPEARSAGSLPPQIIERGLFAVCFAEALLKKLNATLNRSSSELGTIAKQARDQAQAETESLLKLLCV